jgi:hypothetical protein
MNRPTLRALTRWLAPWRTIRKLEAENQRLREQAVLRARFNWEAQKLVDLKYEQLAMAREALRRLSQWAGRPFAKGWDAEVAFDVADWILSGMTGPLPPLPDHIAKRDQPTTTEDL